MARTLKFNIAGQSIEQDPNCDFSGLVPGTEGYLKVEFTFSPEWDGCVKAAVFNIGAPGGEYAAVLKDGKSCDIPDAVCGRPAFKVYVYGQNKDFHIKSDEIIIRQNGR